jgi:hypothetical protein
MFSNKTNSPCSLADFQTEIQYNFTVFLFVLVSQILPKSTRAFLLNFLPAKGKLIFLKMAQISAANFFRIINKVYLSKTYQKFTGVFFGLF